MKRIIISLTLGFLLISCSSSDSNSSSAEMFMWSCKINGVLYEWSGNTEENFSQGAALVLFNSNSLRLMNNDFMISPSNFPSITPGNYTFSQSSGLSCIATLGGETYATGAWYGGAMNFKITSITPYTYQNYDFITKKVTGTFSGTVKSYPNGETLTITEGSFVAMNID